jgi:hypothetical protein
MYSIYDEGLGRLMSAGRNSPTKESAKEALLHYLSGSYSKEELAGLSKLTPDEAAAHIERTEFAPVGLPGASGHREECRFSGCDFLTGRSTALGQLNAPAGP